MVLIASAFQELQPSQVCQGNFYRLPALNGIERELRLLATADKLGHVSKRVFINSGGLAGC